MAKFGVVGAILAVSITLAVIVFTRTPDESATPTLPPGLATRITRLEAEVFPSPTPIKPTPTPRPTPTRTQNVALIAEPGESGIAYGAEGRLRDLCVAIDWESGLTDEQWGTTLESWSDYVEARNVTTVLAMCFDELWGVNMVSPDGEVLWPPVGIPGDAGPTPRPTVEPGIPPTLSPTPPPPRYAVTHLTSTKTADSYTIEGTIQQLEEEWEESQEVQVFTHSVLHMGFCQADGRPMGEAPHPFNTSRYFDLVPDRNPNDSIRHDRALFNLRLNSRTYPGVSGARWDDFLGRAQLCRVFVDLGRAGDSYPSGLYEAALPGVTPTPVPAMQWDQSFVPDDPKYGRGGGASILFSTKRSGQEFRPTCTDLIGVDVYLSPGFTDPPVGTNTVTVNIRKGSVLDPIMASSTQQVEEPYKGAVHFPFEDVVPVSPGELYVLQVKASNTAHSWMYSSIGRYGYPEGEAIQHGKPLDGDHWFRTYCQQVRKS